MTTAYQIVAYSTASTPRSTGEGDLTASTTDNGDYTRHHHSFKTTTVSTVYTISKHQETSYATPSPSPEIPPKRPRKKSPKYTSKQPTRYFHTKIEDEYPPRELRPPGRPRQYLQGHHQGYKSTPGRRRTQY